MGFSRQEYCSGLPFLYPEDLPDPGIEHTSLMSPALAGRFFTMAPPGKPIYPIVSFFKKKMFNWFNEWDFWIILNKVNFSSSIHFLKIVDKFLPSGKNIHVTHFVLFYSHSCLILDNFNCFHNFLIFSIAITFTLFFFSKHLRPQSGFIISLNWTIF